MILASRSTTPASTSASPLSTARRAGVRLLATVLSVGYLLCSAQRGCGVVPALNRSPRPDEYRCHLAWKDDQTLYVGWANSIKVSAPPPPIYSFACSVCTCASHGPGADGRWRWCGSGPARARARWTCRSALWRSSRPCRSPTSLLALPPMATTWCSLSPSCYLSLSIVMLCLCVHVLLFIAIVLSPCPVHHHRVDSADCAVVPRGNQDGELLTARHG